MPLWPTDLLMMTSLDVPSPRSFEMLGGELEVAVPGVHRCDSKMERATPRLVALPEVNLCNTFRITVAHGQVGTFSNN
jgi:hypothetical protein